MKFIQITSASLENNQQTQANWILHALDSDGRIWELDDMHGWREVPLPTPASAQETPPEHCKHGIGWYECSICMHPEAVPGARASRCNHPLGSRSLTNRCLLCDEQVVDPV